MYLFKSVCPDCGGQTTDDYNRKISTCQVCGKVFEAEYLSVDKSLDNADVLYEKEQYKSALQLYSYVLAEDYDNIRALDGFVRSLGKADNISDYIDKGAFAITSDDLAIRKRDSKEEQKDYYDVLEKILSTSREYLKISKKSEEKAAKIHVIQSEINRLRTEKNNVRNYDNHAQNKRTIVSLQILIIYVFLMFVAFLALDIYTFLKSGVLIGLLGLVLVVGSAIGVIVLWRVLKKFRSAIAYDRKLNEDFVKALDEKKAIDSEREKVLGTIKGFLGKARLIVEG